MSAQSLVLFFVSINAVFAVVASSGCLIVFLPAMGMFYVADLLGGAKNLLVGNVIRNQFLVVRDWPFGAAFSVALIAIMAGLLWLYFVANRRINRQGGLDDEGI